MAELTPATSWSGAQTRAQFAAIARLRWRITVNSFRRKGGGGELAARIVTYPFLAALAFGPTIGVGIAAFYFANSGTLDHVSWLLWGTFLFCQLLNIQLGQPGTTFDPTQLIRFPVGAPTYGAIRLFFGILTPANVVGSLMSLAIALGVTFALPGLWFYALLGLGVFAAANVLFSRMVFAWVDRWLATRRARELFTALIFLFSIGIQYLNFTYNPAYNHHHTKSVPTHKLASAGTIYHRVHPYLVVLPPELTAASLVATNQGRKASYFAETAECAAFAALFLAVFALRMRAEFRGESLTDAANSVAKPKKQVVMRESSSRLPLATASLGKTFGLSPTSLVQFSKEFLYVRRNQGILFALVMPLAIAVIFSLRVSTRSSAGWIFPAVVAYCLMGLLQLSFNSFGLEGTGAQFYFLAPVRIRDVMIGKNLMQFLLAGLEILAVLGVVMYTGNIPSASIIFSTLFWAAGTLFFSTALGNQRSLASPKKMNLSSMNRRQTSTLSSLMSMGVMLLGTGVGAAALLLALYLGKQWVLLPVFAIYAVGGFWVYNRILNSIDSFASAQRETLFLELCKPD